MNAPFPETPHPRVHGFPVIGDDLGVGGVPLSRLAARVGRTPFYAYDRGLLSERVAALRTHLPPSVHLSYAVKANPMPAVVQHMARLVDGCDVASSGELATVLDTGLDPARISFAGPGKRSDELAQAVAAGVTINVESPAELEEIARHGERLGITPRVAVRVNPDFELRGSGMRMGGGAKQFGVDAEDVPALLARIGALDLTFVGFHCFWGSQALRPALIREAQEKSVDLILRLSDAAPGVPELVNLGGGFGIPYHDKDSPLPLAEVGEAMAKVVDRLKAGLPDARPGIELGRYLVGEAGVYVCRVVDRKVSRGQVFLVTDGGLHHHLAATGNFGQVLRRNYPVVIGTRMTGNGIEPQSVVGCLCTPLDLLADRVELPRAEAGDLVVIFQSGAYGASASPAAFLGHGGAAEVLV
jgi:diaminopimelate decarboxylase